MTFIDRWRFAIGAYVIKEAVEILREAREARTRAK